MTPPIEKPSTRENRARVRSLSLPRFSRLSRACFSYSFSLSPHRDASTSVSSSPSSSGTRPRPAPPRTVSSYLALPQLPFSDDDVVRAPPAFSLLVLFLYFHPALRALLLPRPASFLFFGVGFAGTRGARRTPLNASPRWSPLLSFSLVLPSCHLLP